MIIQRVLSQFRNTFNKCLISIIVVALSIPLLCHVSWAENRTIYREHDIKAAIVYKLLQFIEWSQEKAVVSDNSPENKYATITIGVFGEDAYDSMNKMFMGKVINDKTIIIHSLNKEEIFAEEADENKEKMQRGALSDYDALFMCHEERIDFVQLLPFIKSHGILTIGEEKGFLEKGGIINFIMEKGKVGFEINKSAAEKAGLHIRSSVLRIAKRVI